MEHTTENTPQITVKPWMARAVNDPWATPNAESLRLLAQGPADPEPKPADEVCLKSCCNTRTYARLGHAPTGTI